MRRAPLPWDAEERLAPATSQSKDDVRRWGGSASASPIQVAQTPVAEVVAQRTQRRRAPGPAAKLGRNLKGSLKCPER